MYKEWSEDLVPWKYDFGPGSRLESPSARIMPGRSGFPVKIKEGGEAREKKEKRGERGTAEKRVKEERDGDHWSDFTLGLFSDGRRYEIPSRACSNSGIPIPWLVEIVTFHPGRVFSKKWFEMEPAKKRQRPRIN